MKYNNTIRGIFVERPNRFIAYVRLEGQSDIVICHVKNTGRCRELLVKGCIVILQDFRNNKGNRKTDFDLIAVYKGNMLVNMDSQAPNAVAYEWISSGGYDGCVSDLRREVKYNNSRFDIFFTRNGNPGFVEVKGVTLENNGVVSFPDAPTQRGVKHIYELMKAKEEGYEAAILFVVQMESAEYFIPNYKMQPEFQTALLEAAKKGVAIKAVCCQVQEDYLKITHEIPIKLTEDMYYEK